MQSITSYAPTLLTYTSREDLGSHAGKQAAQTLRKVLSLRGHARLMLAAADSQQETLQALADEPNVDWANVECFHMDEYVGLPAAAPQLFGNWLQRIFFDKLPNTVTFHRIKPANDGEEAAARYESAMGTEPFDVVLLGLGVNCHLAFNEPPADLSDPRSSRVVGVGLVSRQQQVDEGHFPGIHAVPERAVTVTIPRLLNATEIIASVPGSHKQRAVIETLTMPIDGKYPGTALRTHQQVWLYLDSDSDPSQGQQVPQSSTGQLGN